jgi:hypothetical protein
MSQGAGVALIAVLLAGCSSSLMDGLMGDSSVDPSPLTVVRAYAPRHAVGTRLLFLHN